MKKQTIIILVIIGMIAASIGFVALRRDTNAQQASPNPEQQSAKTAAPIEATASETSAPTPSSTPAQPTAGRYVSYSADAFDIAEGRRVLFFHAAWCPQCQALEKDINAKGVPSGMTILKVNYDNSQSLRQKYGVTMQTTFVEVDASGNLKKKFVAYNDPTLAAVTNALGN